MAKILLVEDDVPLALEVQEWLQDMDGHAVECAMSGEDAVQLLTAFGYDLIILDWNLPGITGISVCKKFRDGGGQTPVLFLTTRSEITDKESGFDVGADDYLPKPFNIQELSARCKALLRRSRDYVELSNSDKQYKLVPDTNQLYVGDKSVQLSKMECAVLSHFMRNPGRQFSSADLLREVWPSTKESSEDAVRVLISTLRKKLAAVDDKAASELIKTIPGVGYMYNP